MQFEGFVAVITMQTVGNLQIVQWLVDSRRGYMQQGRNVYKP